MRVTRRHFTSEFKLSVIAELEPGKLITQVAREHSIHPSMIYPMIPVYRYLGHANFME